MAVTEPERSFVGPAKAAAAPHEVFPVAKARAPRVRAIEFIRRMRGASQPCLLRCEDGSSYVVKFLNNPQHARVLANEMLAARLAQALGLSVAAPAFVEIPPELSTLHLDPERGGLPVSCCPGLHFGSRFPGDPSGTLVVDFLPDRLLRQVPNLNTVFAGTFVFDKWTCNCDGRQMVFHRRAAGETLTYSAALIDQGFCFNDGDWTFPDSPLRGLYPRLTVYASVRGLESFEPFLSRVENLSRSDLAACADGIPPDWCAPEPDQFRQLLDTLYDRRRKLRQAIIDAKNCSIDPFPNWR